MPTDYQKSLMQHTLGGEDPEKWFRNYFVASPGHSDLADLRCLEGQCLMKQIPRPGFLEQDAIVFAVTNEGKEFLKNENQTGTLSVIREK